MRVSLKKVALIGSGATVLALGIAIPTMAIAQEPTPSPTASASDTPGADRAERMAQRQDRMAELLAAELGLSKEDVAAALEKVQTQLRGDAQAERKAALADRLDTAVAEGKLTQEQADAILAAAEAGVLGGGGPGGGGPGWFGGHGPGR